MASLDRNDRNSRQPGASRSKVTLTPPSKGISSSPQGYFTFASRSHA
ncbi:MAG: hypothetical protein OXC82_02680 [Rhodobacteraceae bacterium]|nr:hypothetical protein [Paracoccaceae bacterium]